MQRKEYLHKKRKTKVEESALKCEKLTHFFSKEGIKESNQTYATLHTDCKISESSCTRIDDLQSPATDESMANYRGYTLSITKIQEKVGNGTLSVYHEKIGSRKRLLAKCFQLI